MARRAFLILAFILLAMPLGFAKSDTFDLVISSARVVDGSGNPWYLADVGVRDGIIVEIGKLSQRAARRVIDARGLVLSPGFIDMMGGTTLPLLLDPVTAQSKLRQGVTTMMAGEGDSLAPQDERTIKELNLPAGISHWTTFEEYDRLLDAKRIGINVIHNVGAAQVRRVVIGDEDRTPTPEQLAKMKEIVAKAMEDGSAGLSTALIYPPGTYAKTEEIIELAKIAAANGGVYFSHMRNESGQLLEAIQETIRIGEEANIPVHIYHLKAAGQSNWPLMTKAIELIQSARDRGVDVTADVYPYIRNGIGLGSFVHPRHYANGTDAFLPTLSDANVRAELRKEIETTSNWENWYQHVGKNWDNVLVVQVPATLDKRYEGKSVQEIAALRGADAWETFFYLVQQGGIEVNPKSMNEEQKQQALRATFVSIGSDAEPMNPAVSTYAHPRTFGTFPRILAKYVREEKVISLETAIREMTSLPANQLKLWNRGRVAPGFAADLVLFNPAKVVDTATFEKPMSYPVGMEYVLVNGQLAIDGGQATGALAGRVIRANR
ncbi:MAG: D-aminoacylase [Candidatus Acidiferrum sp.]|jgi:N-acyl-D-aspartate/D-glutamate deacylase